MSAETADVIVVGAGVQGASLVFSTWLDAARASWCWEGASVAAGATGRSSGFVRMHYDLRERCAAGMGLLSVLPRLVGPGRSR